MQNSRLDLSNRLVQHNKNKKKQRQWRHYNGPYTKQQVIAKAITCCFIQDSLQKIELVKCTSILNTDVVLNYIFMLRIKMWIVFYNQQHLLLGQKFFQLCYFLRLIFGSKNGRVISCLRKASYMVLSFRLRGRAGQSIRIISSLFGKISTDTV